MKKKLSLKGMTLMEVIIAIAVMAILGMIVAMAGVSAIYNLRIAKNVQYSHRTLLLKSVLILQVR